MFIGKICSKCKKFKEANEFYKDKRRKDGFQSQCKSCVINFQKNSLKCKEYRKNYIKTNEFKNSQKKSLKKYRETVRGRKITKEGHTKYMKKRRKTDVNFRLSGYLRTRIYEALKNNWKSKRTLELLGCSVEELKQYIEKRFFKGMSWDNYGQWHIDHIIPCAAFDLSKQEHQCKCFHYSNLQPLWAIDNIIKKDKIQTGQI